MVVKPQHSPFPLLLAALVFVACSAAFVHRVRPSTAHTSSSVDLVAFAAMQGSFRAAETPVQGGFRIHQEGSQLVLELSSDFKTNDLAPDLKITFSPSTTPLATSSPPAYPLRAGSYTVMAPLRSTSGAQRYVIPASIDLPRQGSILIWCEKFNATMAWAPLK
ncbi:DM13 domain-containing protein [Synechococcus sp. KORDI-52]|uniref:DM13 domain-containing protein n=1 Tax=Synechococcus sp. KORDI-52 TaxID=585425 RepID=UPI000570ED9A|nr:DM13 domain-containing protein [Synechococcus sp. KORDI-52]